MNKRILRDILDIQKNPLHDNGIYIHYDEDNITNIKALIIGPEDTPYSYGYYFFDIQFTKEYPFKPPKVKYDTRYDKIRFNPNLYTCGKVCVSILNTWSGPQWTSCQTLRSVLISLQSILQNNPIHNEPGYENDYSSTNDNYNQMINYENINTAIYKMITDTPKSYEVFKDIMIENFNKNYTQIIEKLETFKTLDNKVIVSIYTMKSLVKYSILKDNLINLFQQYNNLLENNHENTIIDNDTNNIIEKVLSKDNNNIVDNQTKKIRKAPNAKAKLFDVNYQMNSENDSHKYMVVLDKNGVKKWKKIVI